MPTKKEYDLDTDSGVNKDFKVKPVAEVVSSSITDFTAQCFNNDNDEPNLPEKPRFGSFLKVDSQENGIAIIAVVVNVKTGPQDNIHRPSALGLTRQELQVEQPQIFSLLKTEVHAKIVGHMILDRAFQHLPPQPPEVHDFVYQAQTEEVRQMTSDFEFLRLLVNVSDVPQDELIAATIREAHIVTGLDDQFLVEAGKKLSSILRSDYDRLLAILRKIKPVIDFKVND